VINVNRCAKVVKAAAVLVQRSSRSATRSRVGVGLGKANEVADAIHRASGEEGDVPRPSRA
jgi:ribosomal protein S5